MDESLLELLLFQLYTYSGFGHRPNFLALVPSMLGFLHDAGRNMAMAFHVKTINNSE